MNPETIHWIAVDWGTTNLRCWAMSESGDVLDTASSDQGMSVLAGNSEAFENALLACVDPWLRDGTSVPVHACGMVGARQGWIEVPYESAPCSPLTGLTRIPGTDPRIEVFLHAGICQSDPADVMRGEETQIAGLLRKEPDFEGLVCLPGTHTKWATISDGDLQHFRTCMTGELWSLLAEQSVLRLTLDPEGWVESAFLEAFTATWENPGDLLSQCFSLRAEALLHGLDGAAASSKLSGILIGHELASVLKGSESPERVAILGSPSNATFYEVALSSLEVETCPFASEEVTLRGLAAGFESRRAD